MDLKKQAAIDLIEAKADKIAGIADRIWEYAELSLQEIKSAAFHYQRKQDSLLQ